MSNDTLAVVTMLVTSLKQESGLIANRVQVHSNDRVVINTDKGRINVFWSDALESDVAAQMWPVEDDSMIVGFNLPKTAHFAALSLIGMDVNGTWYFQ